MRWPRILLLSALLLPLLSGCGASARRQLADSRQRIEVLQAQADQLRNETLSLRNRNRDLAQRAVDDARNLHDLERDNARLQRAIVSYQDERREVTEALHQLQDRVYRQATADDPTPQARVEAPAEGRPRNPDRFAAFARAQPGTRFDVDRATWSVPPDALFRPGSSELNPQAPLILDAFARLAADPDDPAAPSRILYAPSPEIRRAGLQDDDLPSDPALDGARAQTLRRELAQRLGVEPDQIALSVAPATSSRALMIELSARRR